MSRLDPFRCLRSVWDWAPSVVIVLSTACSRQNEGVGEVAATEERDLALRLSHDPNAKGLIESLKKRVAAEPGDVQIRFQLAEALSRYNLTTEARQELRRVLELDPGNDRARILFVDGALYRGEIEEARKQIAAGLTRKETAALRVAEAKACLAESPARVDDAEKSLRRALELEPNHVDAAFQLARIRLQQDDARAAVPLLRAVAAQDPRHLGARFNLARALRMLGSDEEADAVAAEHRRLSHLEDLGHLEQPHGVDACLALAQMFAAGGDLEAALPEIDGAIAAAPSDPMPWIVKGRILSAAGRTIEATAAFDAGMRIGASDVRLLNEFAWHLVTKCEAADAKRRALKLAEQAARLTKNQDANVLDTLAVVRARLGDKNGALAAIDAALRIAPENPEFRKRRAELAAGDPGSAR